MAKKKWQDQEFVVIDEREQPIIIEAEIITEYMNRISGDAVKMLLRLLWLEAQSDEVRRGFSFVRMLDFRPSQAMAAEAELRRLGLLYIEEKDGRIIYGVATRAEREANYAKPAAAAKSVA